MLYVFVSICLTSIVYKKHLPLKSCTICCCLRFIGCRLSRCIMPFPFDSLGSQWQVFGLFSRINETKWLSMNRAIFIGFEGCDLLSLLLNRTSSVAQRKKGRPDAQCVLCLFFILETHKQMPKFVQTDNASSNIKTANDSQC